MLALLPIRYTFCSISLTIYWRKYSKDEDWIEKILLFYIKNNINLVKTNEDLLDLEIIDLDCIQLAESSGNGVRSIGL